MQTTATSWVREESNHQGWVREGQFIKGLYLGQYAVSGWVMRSRVKDGGAVQHTIVLEHDLIIGFGSDRKAGSVISIDEDEVVNETY